MPCIPLKNGFVCVGNEPVAVKHNGRTYYVEWTAASGWVPVNRDGSERLSPLPKAVWDRVKMLPRPK